MNERVIREPEDEVADIVGLGGCQLLEDTLDAALVLICLLGGAHCIARDESLLHGLLLQRIAG